MVKRLWLKIRAWLEGVPVADPVERRNAPLVQTILLAMGVLMPLNKIVHLFFASFRESLSSPGLVADMITDVVMTAAAWAGLILIRRGQFRRGVILYLGVMLGCAAFAYASIGLERLSNDPFPLLMLGMGGLMLGRRSLWTIYAALMGVFCLGTLGDVLQQWPHGAIDWQVGRKVSMAMSYAVVAIVLDRTIAALRDSLSESNARGAELARSNTLLQAEMAERERAQSQLVHAQKMEAAGHLASGVAHDFDNVLNVVLGYAKRRERDADKGTDALLASMEGVEVAARRALSISRKLLDFSGKRVIQCEHFDAGDALRDVAPMLRQIFDGTVRVRIDAQGCPATVAMDRAQFELMLLNVAANARDAMPTGGAFDVVLRCRGDEVELCMVDDGCGMATDVRERAFDPFFTTKPVGRGTGLGLATLRDTVVAAGGSVWVDSAPGHGTRIGVRLPLVSGPLQSGVSEKVA